MRPPDEVITIVITSALYALTKMEKNNLLRSIDEIKRPFASKETTDDESQTFDILSECKDTAFF